MRHKLLILLLTITFGSTLMAGTYSPENLPIPYLQDKTRYTVNPDHILSAATVASIDSLLYKLETNKGVQALAIVVENVEGGDCYEFAITLGNKYGIGSRNDTGFIILLSTEDRCYQFLTGEGLEGTLPDAICRRIQNRYMVPYLKTGDWDKAMLQATEAACKVIEGDMSLINDGYDNRQPDKKIGLSFYLFTALFLLIILFSWFKNKKQSSCPYCKKSGIRRINTEVTIDRLQMIEHHKETYRCTHCGKTFHRFHDEPWDNGSGFGGFPPIAGPFHRGFGGGFSGGPFGGGSFGGGSFGGGGSGGRF